jgi:hypothetical protein
VSFWSFTCAVLQVDFGLIRGRTYHSFQLVGLFYNRSHR